MTDHELISRIPDLKEITRLNIEIFALHQSQATALQCIQAATDVLNRLTTDEYHTIDPVVGMLENANKLLAEAESALSTHTNPPEKSESEEIVWDESKSCVTPINFELC